MSVEQENNSTLGLSQWAQYAVAGTLAAVLIGIVLYQFAGSSEASAAPSETDRTPEKDQQFDLPEAGPAIPQEPNVPEEYEKLTRNPFVLPRSLKKKLEERKKDQEAKNANENGPDPDVVRAARGLALKGIIGAEGWRRAYVNDKTVSEGDAIAGFTIVEVKKRSVVVQKGKTTVEVKMKPSGRQHRREDDLTPGQ